MVLEADYTYLESSKEFLSGRFEIKNSFDESFREFRFESRLGQAGEDDIDGENGTSRLRDVIGALPMLVAEEGLAPAVPAETAPPASKPAANDRLTESTVTTRTVWSVIGVLLLATALVVLVVGGVRSLRKGGS
ncbi:hypothetical protein E1281_34250 [Actinomadura sp. KC345]|nr:hypothetical protein E1281_34250 [Actinomadura sp. KC345]